MTSMNTIKIPCCAVLGHVDVGKTKLLDLMRRSDTEEASGITQQIGATLYTRDRLETLVGPVLKDRFTIDSLLMIDTPGHECFDMIRYVALKVADITILMIDMLKGLEKQTIAVIEMLQKFNRPFIVCVNKMDRIYGWTKPKSEQKLHLKAVLSRLNDHTSQLYHDYVEKIKMQLYELDISSELYYQNRYAKSVVNIVPISAETGEGVPDVIMLISRMAERNFVKDTLIDNEITHGYILDSHYDKQHGKYKIALHRYGSLEKGDIVKINDNKYRVHTILVNNDNHEIKDEHRFGRVSVVDRSTGCGLLLDPLNRTVNTDLIEPSSLFIKCDDKDEHYLSKVQDLISTDPRFKTIDSSEYEKNWSEYLCPKGVPGVQIVAPSYIMMDGFLHMLTSSTDTSIERYKVGNITKIDTIVSGKWISSVKSKEDRLEMKKYSVILSYDPSTERLSDDIMKLAEQNRVTIIHSDVVYRLIEEYQRFVDDINKQIESMQSKPTSLVSIIPKYIFRTSDPMVFGIKVIEGTVNVSDKIYSDPGLNTFIGKIESMQKDRNSVESATVDDELCLKVDTKKVIGTDIDNDSELYLSNK